MSVLSASQISEYMRKESLNERLIITPFQKEAIGPSSIDVRLGNQFILIKKQTFPYLDKKDDIDKINKYPQKVIIKYDQPFYLHPRQLVLGCTFEYIHIPIGLMAYVVGKSTWGRMGLIIATATKVDPGFKGCITLEIINEGEVPIALYPKQEIAQLVFHQVKGQNPETDIYKGRYDCPIGPQFPRFSSKKKLIGSDW